MRFSSPNSHTFPTFYPQIGGGSLFLWTPLAAPTCLLETERYFQAEKTMVAWLYKFEVKTAYPINV